VVAVRGYDPSGFVVIKGTAAARFALIFDGEGFATPFQGNGMKGAPALSIKSCIGFAIG